MKKIVLGILAASVLAAPAAAAPFNGFGHNNNHGRYEQSYRGNFGKVRGFDNHRWNRGQRFDSRYARNYRVISNPRAYRLYDAPRGYRWVQSGNDAVLVAIASGLIGAVIGSALN